MAYKDLVKLIGDITMWDESILIGDITMWHESIHEIYDVPCDKQILFHIKREQYIGDKLIALTYYKLGYIDREHLFSFDLSKYEEIIRWITVEAIENLLEGK